MTEDSENQSSTPTPQELREMVEGTREELGLTVEELAARADLKGQAKDKVNEKKAEVMEAAIEAGTQAREGFTDVVHLAQDTVAEPAREMAATAAAKVAEGGATVAGKVRESTPEPVAVKVRQAAEAVRRRPGPAIAMAVAAVVAFVTVRRRARR